MEISEVRKRFSEVLNAAQSGDRVVITRRGKPIVAVISMKDLRALGHAGALIPSETWNPMIWNF